MLEVLSALAARRDFRVAVVSGRALSDLRARCPVPGCWYVGGHGNETTPGAGDDLGPPPAPPRAQAMRQRLAEIAATLRERLPQWPGVRLEAKPYSLALHFRQAPEWEEPIRELVSGYAAGDGFRTLSGRQVIELLPDDALTKGHALERLLRRLGCDLAFYFGDDTTDEDVFRLHNPQLLGIKVESRENPAPSAADYAVGSPREVLLALHEIAHLRPLPTTAHPAKKNMHNEAIQP